MGTSPVSLRDVLHERRAEIMDALAVEAERRGFTPKPFPKDTLVHQVGELIDELSEALAGEAEVRAAASRKHAAERWSTDFSLGSLVRLHGVLRESIVAVANESGVRISAMELGALASAIDVSVTGAVDEYVRVRDTQAARSSRQLDEATAILEWVIVAAPVGFALFDGEMKFRMINPRLAEIHGVAREDHIGRTPSEVLPRVPAELVANVHEEVMQSGQPRSMDVVTETPATGGRVHTYATHWYPVKAESVTIGVGLLVEDVTERRASELFRDRIVAIVSHDLRNPIQAISAASAALLEADMADGARRLVGTIVRAAARMQGIVGQLYDYMHIDREGSVPLEVSRVDAGEVARRVVEEVQLAFSGQRVDVRLQIEGDTSGQWDGGRIAQVLTNLIRNAIEHGEGACEVRVRGIVDRVTIEVANVGVPIPAAALDRIFEPFRSESRTAGHLGLGLYIAREIVRAHGGTIAACSGREGTVFSVALPRAQGVGAHHAARTST